MCVHSCACIHVHACVGGERIEVGKKKEEKKRRKDGGKNQQQTSTEFELKISLV